ncbi:MAG: hypothetical protein SF052_00280 [Bacteroidia bacterium]|nr:hypothetical protein [Bacteroidia bacterium]
MKYAPISLMVVLSLFSFSLNAQQRIPLEKALAQRLVKIMVKGNGGFQGQCIKLALKNETNGVISVEVPPGQMFISEDSSVQDLITTAPVYVALEPGGSKTTDIFTMCTQSYNMSPSSGERFDIGTMAEGYLRELAEKIAKGNYQNSTAQSAIWAVANRDPIADIYGTDTAMVRDVVSVVSEAWGIPVSQFNLQPREHRITSINTSMEGLIRKHIYQARLAVYDKEGNLVRQYFEGKHFEPGFMQYRIGVNHTMGDSAELYLRLTDGTEVIMERQVFADDTIAPLKRIHAQAVMTFLVKESGEASVGVYDSEDQLYFYIVENRTIREGFNRGTYIAGKHLPPGKDYYIKVKMKGETLASEKIDPNSAEPQVYPLREVSGIFSFRQEQAVDNVKLIIYDREGRVKKMLFDIHHLNPGDKRYSYRFEHRDGPDAVFFVRLVDAEGKVLQEKEIR